MEEQRNTVGLENENSKQKIDNPTVENEVLEQETDTAVAENEIQKQSVTTPVNNTKRLLKILLISIVSGIGLFILTIALVIILNMPFSIYARAESKLDKGKYDKAIVLYERISEYKDSKTNIEYATACKYLSEEKYEDAISEFEKLEEFKDSKAKLNDAYYLFAEQKMVEKDYESAKKYYSKTENKEDIDAKIQNCNLMYAESSFKDGDLAKAKELFSSLPKDLTFEGISVAKRLDTLKKNEKLVAMCGTWSGKNGKMSVRQTHDSTGLWDQWDGNFTDSMTLKCILNDDGTFTLKGKAKYYIYLNYSSLSTSLKTLEMSEDFTVTGKSIPASIYSNSSTKITYDGKNFNLSFDSTNDTYSMNFTYRYKSSVTYTK